MSRVKALNAAAQGAVKACTGKDCKTGQEYSAAVEEMARELSVLKGKPTSKIEPPKRNFIGKYVQSLGVSHDHGKSSVTKEEIVQELESKYGLKPTNSPELPKTTTTLSPKKHTTSKQDYCPECKDMHPNKDYEKPDYQCRKCGYHIPKQQKEDGVCPGCGSQKWKSIDWDEIDNLKDEDLTDE